MPKAPLPSPDAATDPASLPPLLFHVERAQERLNEVAALSGQTERLAMLGTMAASVAHEINNILTPVKAYAELALSSPGDTGLVIKALERAAHGVDRATRIAEMILECAKGKAKNPLADVGDTVKRVIAALPANGSPMFHVEHPLPPGLIAAIDPVALEQVFLNLLLNARAAMPNGGTVTISGWVSAAGVELRVVDTGHGIPAERLNSVFTTFVSYSDKADGSRTGLGLPICRRLVSDAGGSIDLDSQVGKGTTVKLVLPAPASARRVSA